MSTDKSMISKHNYQLWYRVKGHTQLKFIQGNAKTIDSFMNDENNLLLKLQDDPKCVCFACILERDGKKLRATEARRARNVLGIQPVAPRKHTRKKKEDADA